MMPSKSGFEVCEEIKRNPDLKDIVVIILTAKGQNLEDKWAAHIGADYFLSKPFSPMELLGLIENIVSKQYQTDA